MKFEKFDDETGESYTWTQNESLHDLQKPERIEEIKNDQKRRQALINNKTNLPLSNVFGKSENDGSDDGCLICHL